MSCLKCGGTVLLDRNEDDVMAMLLRLGRVCYCVNCGKRYFERIAQRPMKLPQYEPYHRNLRL